MKSLEQKAEELMLEVHKGQTRNDGITPYSEHIYDVVKVVKELGGSYHEIQVAYLHDCVEDYEGISSEIERKIHDIFGHEILNDVLALTHLKGIPYQDYIDSMLNKEEVLLVKLADLIVNLTDKPRKDRLKDYKLAIIKVIKNLYYL